MLFYPQMLRLAIKKADDRRDRNIKEPEVESFLNLPYSESNSRFYRLDIYRPIGVKGKLTTALVVHGGGFLYGDKERYHLYAKELARLGLAVVCMSYPYGDKKHFPHQLECIDQVLLFMHANAEKYGFDIEHTCLVGDSAGACLSFQYGLIAKNEQYRKLFNVSVPIVPVGLVLNCGLYTDLGTVHKKDEAHLWRAYLGKNFDANDPRYKLIENLTEDFMPCYLMSCEKDFLLPELGILDEALNKHGIPHVTKQWKSDAGDKLFHVFHLKIDEEEALACNEEEVEWMKSI